MNTIKPPTGNIPRTYLPTRFKVTVWSKLKPYYNDLLKRPIKSTIDLKRWIADKAELDAAIAEELLTRETVLKGEPDDKRSKEIIDYIQSEICPRIDKIETEIAKRMKKDLSRYQYRLFRQSFPARR